MLFKMKIKFVLDVSYYCTNDPALLFTPKLKWNFAHVHFLTKLIDYTYYLGKFVLGSILNNIFFTDKNRNTENESGSNEFEL